MELSLSERGYQLAGHPPSGWEQIEDQRAVAGVLARLSKSNRTAVYACPELYELAYPGYPGDRGYYLSQTKTGRVLYLGVGTGRIFLPMAAQNPDVYGVESSSKMCDLLERRQPRLRDRVFECDASQAPVAPASLDTVVAPYSFLQVVGRERVAQLLGQAYRWLKPGGRFLSDTFSPYAIPFRRPGLETSIRQIGAQTRISIYVLYNHVAQQMQELALIERGTEPSRVLDMRLDYFFPRELLSAMQTAGFTPVNLQAGFEGQPFDPVDSDVVLYEAIKPHDEAVPVHANGSAKM